MKIVVRALLLTLCLFEISIGNGQSKLDSLRLALAQLSPDTTYFNTLKEISNYYIENNQPDSALSNAQKSMELAKSLNFKKGIGISYNQIGQAYRIKGYFNLALDNLIKGIQIFEDIGFQRGLGITYLLIGNLHRELNELTGSGEHLPQAIHHYKEGLTILKKLNSEEDVIAAIGQIGLAYSQLQQPDSAVFYLNQAIEKSRLFKYPELELMSTINLANVYLFPLQDFKRATEGHRKAIQLAVQINSTEWEAFCYGVLGQNFQGQKQYDSAEFYIKKCIALLHLHSPEQEAQWINALSQVYSNQKKWNKVITQSNAILSIKSLPLQTKLETFRLLSGSYEELGDYQKSLQFQKLYASLRDSITHEDQSSKLLRLTNDFAASKQNSFIELLQKESLVKDLKLVKQNQNEILIFVILVLSILFIVILINRNRLIKKANREQHRIFKELDLLKSRFFANISHEFRTPLTLILGPVQKRLLQAETTEEKVELSLVYRNAQRLLKLVNQLLDLSKLEAGNMKIAVHQTDLVSFVRLVAQSFHSMAEVRSITFTVKSEWASIPVYFDPEKMEKIINNLLSNAFKFTPAGGEVTISLHQQQPDSQFLKGTVEILVHDNGIGISPSNLEKIFDRFYQVDNSQTREYEGTGIGLALTKELVELHHGTISVTSSPSAGTAFSVKLRLGHAHFKADEIQESALLPETLKYSAEQEAFSITANNFDSIPMETVIIIEDNADLRYYLVQSLSAHYSVLEASNGEDGLLLAFEKIPDLIISDLMMPKMDGIQVSKQIKSDERTSHIPVILLTAKADSETKIQGLELGADDYISKPFEMKELLARVRNLIESRKKLQQKFADHVTLLPKKISVTSVDDRFLQKIMSIVENNISNTTFGVEPFAIEVGMSGAQLYRKLRALTGFSPNDFIRHMRLQRASDLLQQKAGNVAEVAYQVGFNNLSYFSKCFKEKFGQTPSEYSKLSHDKESPIVFK